MAKHFADAFQSLQGVDLATSKADAKGTSLGAKSWGCLKPEHREQHILVYHDLPMFTDVLKGDDKSIV